MTNMTRIFSEKSDVVFKDKYGGESFTVKELNDNVLKPTMRMGMKELADLEDWLERFEKE